MLFRLLLLLLELKLVPVFVSDVGPPSAFISTPLPPPPLARWLSSSSELVRSITSKFEWFFDCWIAVVLERFEDEEAATVVFAGAAVAVFPRSDILVDPPLTKEETNQGKMVTSPPLFKEPLGER